MRTLDVRAYAVLDPKLQVIYGIVEGTSEADVITQVIYDHENLLFDGRRGARQIEVRDVADLREDFWYEVASDVNSAGHCGGDVQVSDSVSRRFAHPVHRNKDWAVVDVAWYVCDDTESSTMPRGRWLERQETRTRCEDLRDPGGTETWEGSRYYDDEEWPAEEASMPLAAAAFDAVTQIGWDGNEDPF